MTASSVAAFDSLTELTGHHDDQIIPVGFGPVHLLDGQYRCLLMDDLPEADFPRTPRFGDLMLAGAQELFSEPGAGPRLRAGLAKLDLQGWLFAGEGWWVQKPSPLYKDSFSEHPRRFRSYSVLYLDRDGTLTQHVDVEDGQPCRHIDRQPRPAEGWETLGAMPATMELFWRHTLATNR